MPAIVPSYIDKASRAEKHLIDLKAAIDAYSATHPYTVSERIEGKKKPAKVRRLEFTADPANTEIPVIAADAVINLRAALDHLMNALVANKDRGTAMFLIYFQGVWEAIVPGENQERIKQRERWASDIKTLSDAPIAILKRLQPPDDAEGDRANMLHVINGLANRDRHERLPVIAAGLREIRLTWNLPGRGEERGFAAQPDVVYKDKARLRGIPEDAVDVKIEGTRAVAIRVGSGEKYIELPDHLDHIARGIKDGIIPELVPSRRAR
jgi:hypothetical protein